MKLSQPRESIKEFVAILDSHFPSLHPEYVRNRDVKGIRYEYLRKIEDDLFAIHSVICIKGTFYHCFCLSRHRRSVGPYLYSPFTIGGRCDHNYTVTRACHSDLGLSPIDPLAPFRMSSSHSFRTGADNIIRRCTAEAEARLLPFYHSVWNDTRGTLQEFLDFCASTQPQELAAYASECEYPKHKLSCHMLEFRELHRALRPDQRNAFFAATALAIPEIIENLLSVRELC